MRSDPARLAGRTGAGGVRAPGVKWRRTSGVPLESAQLVRMRSLGRLADNRWQAHRPERRWHVWNMRMSARSGVAQQASTPWSAERAPVHRDAPAGASERAVGRPQLACVQRWRCTARATAAPADAAGAARLLRARAVDAHALAAAPAAAGACTPAPAPQAPQTWRARPQRTSHRRPYCPDDA